MENNFIEVTTLKDIAREVGISVAATSLALRNDLTLSEDTKRRVWDAQLKLGYRRRGRGPGKKQKAAARGVQSVAFVLMDKTFQHPAYSSIFEGMAGAAGAGDITPIHFSLKREEVLSGKLPSLLRNSEVDGIIVSGAYDIRIHEIFEQLRLPLVVVGNYPLRGKSFAACEIDARQAIIELLDHLAKLGHRKIGLIFNALENDVEQTTHVTYQEETKRLGLDYGDKFIRVSSKAGGNAAVARDLLMLPDRPTALIISDPAMAGAVYDEAHQMELDVPRDLSVACLTIMGHFFHYRPKLTAVEIDGVQMGKIAFSKLLRLAETPPAIKTREIFPATFIPGGSTATARKVPSKSRPSKATDLKNSIK